MAVATTGESGLKSDLFDRIRETDWDLLIILDASVQSEGYNVRLAYAESFSFDEAFDVITAGELIKHLGKPAAFLERCMEHLTPSGSVVLTTPNPDGFAYFRKALIRETGNPTHTCWIDPENLEQLVEVSGSNLVVNEWTYLPPTGGVSKLLWNLGKKREASFNYVALLKNDGCGTRGYR